MEHISVVPDTHLTFFANALLGLEISQMVDSGSRKSAKLWKSGIMYNHRAYFRRHRKITGEVRAARNRGKSDNLFEVPGEIKVITRGGDVAIYPE